MSSSSSINRELPMRVAISGRTLAATLLCLWLADVCAIAEPFRITHNNPFPPFTEFKDGKSQGLTIDLLRAAAVRVGIELEFVASPLEQMEQTLKDGRADALLVAVTPERLKSYDVSSPVLNTGGGLFTHVPNPAPDNLAALSGKVVVTPGTGPLAALIRKDAPTVNLAITTDYAQSLARGRRHRGCCSAELPGWRDYCEPALSRPDYDSAAHVPGNGKCGRGPERPARGNHCSSQPGA
jgi:ABC-type amino acid transport substrate-binding protein